jgi:23S rRNA pseudouridine2605 synthase
MPERVQKLIANAGYCSRRKAEELILQGKVVVNGRIAKIGESAEPSDQILVEGKRLGNPDKRYVLLNKPVGYETTLKSTFHKPTVISLVNTKERLIPAGRLDTDSRGLLLLTNDGELAHRVMHPRYPIDKVYEVTVKGTLGERELERLRSGIRLEEGMTYPCKVRVLKRTGDGVVLEMILHEGKKRQIRRMIEAVGSEVTDLVRVRIGLLTIDGLQEGKYRDLARKEVDALKNILKMESF